MKMHIGMETFAKSGVLAGAISGREAFGALMELIGDEPENPELVFLDFRKVQVATASFLRECVLEFRDMVRRRWVNYYPVVTNANDSIIEELLVLLAQKDALLLCALNKNGKPNSPRLIGKLEPKQKIAFGLVKKLGEADAGQLMDSAKKNDSVGQTAWNNRLASLNRLGLLIEMSHGKTKRYQPLPLGA